MQEKPRLITLPVSATVRTRVETEFMDTVAVNVEEQGCPYLSEWCEMQTGHLVSHAILLTDKEWSE